MTFEKIKVALKKWSETRNVPEKATAFLKQGCCIKVEKDQYEQWKKRTPESVYAYLGLFDNELKFVLIDSESDKDPEQNMDAVFVIDYLEGLNITEMTLIKKATDGNISVTEALQRNLNWILFMESWLYNKAETTEGVFRAFIIPFSSFKAQFEVDNYSETVILIGLEDNQQADLILWKHNMTNDQEKMAVTLTDGPTPVENLVYPCPPYSGPNN